MEPEDQEKSQLRSVALQNAQSILLARQRAEEELLRAKEALESRTQELAQTLATMRATLESTTDGILVTDGAGKVTSFNDNFVTMWQIPRAIMDARDHRQVLEAVCQHFKDPRQFLATVDDIYASSPSESYDLLELSDGRVIERFSRIQFINDQNVGRVWSFRDITDRRRAEEALQKQAEWLQVTLSSIGDAVITTDTEGRVTSLNPVAESLTGWSEREAQGMALARVFQIVNEQSRQPVENPATRALAEGCIVGLANHTVLVAKDGAERVIDDSAAPIKDEHGKTLGAVLVFRDVTERRRAEEASLHLSAVVDSSDDAIVTKSLQGVIRSWNAGAQRIFGYAAAEVIGKPITILLPPERLHEEEEILRRLRRGERVDHFETVRVHKEGRPIDVSVTISPIRDAAGHVIGASKIARDITRRKKAEKTAHFLASTSSALAELTDYESTLQKVAGLAVPFFADWCAVDMQEADGSVRRLAVMHNDAAKVHVAHELGRRFPPHSSDPVGVMNVLRTGETEWVTEITDAHLAEWTRDAEHLRLVRELGLKSYICVPLRSQNRALGALTFATAESGRNYDIDDLQAAQDLAHRAVVAIENANLLSALKDSDRRKDEFLAMLAHELRNPLAPIRNAVQIIRAKGPLVPELQWARDVIDRQAEQMTRLVDDLLDVSRITRGKIELRRQRVQLGTIVASAVEASRPLIEKWGHELTVTLPPDAIYLDADPTRLAQVLLNLLNNAAKYMEQGGRIWLAGERIGNHVLIRVKDTGIGIAPEMLPRIFDMFTQVERSLERSQGGLGIGLTLVQRLVELHGGTVEAQSAGPGKGSEFVVRLPVADEFKSEVARKTDSSGEPAPPPPKCRILVVDDNKDSADSLGMLLRLTGNEVATAHDGLEAVGAAAVFRPDVILLDIGLPKLNGYEVARRIREQRGGEVILIAVTGWGQPDDRRRSKEAGFDHHLTKPVEFSELQQLLAATKK